MASYLPEHAQAFRDIFAKLENLLRRSGYTLANRKRAVVDWERFANELGEPFFDRIRNSGKATMLIAEPPRFKHRDGRWKPEVQIPIKDVVELIVRGLCQVRNNIVHGEKYVDPEGPRSDTLVAEANWILQEAIESHPITKQALAAVR